jgi:hypothetical protein
MVAAPASLFCKAHVDTMYMPHASGYYYILQAHCSLLSYPEHRKLQKENGDNPNTTQTPEYTKDKYNVKIIK